MIKLYNGDCSDILKSIPDGSVDLILQDAPYNTTACKWEWDIMTKIDEFWSDWNRIIKPNGAIVMFGSEPFSSKLRLSNLKMYKYDWKWKKKNAPNYPHAKNMPLKIIEDIVIFSNGIVGHKIQAKDKRMEYNPQGLEDCSYERKAHRGKANEDLYTRPSHIGIQTITKKRYPKNLLEFDYDYNLQLHPTQKPVTLMEYLIKTYTNEGETVFDGFMGSGTPGVAAKNLGRNFIGVELDEKYFNIAKERIGN